MPEFKPSPTPESLKSCPSDGDGGGGDRYAAAGSAFSAGAENLVLRQAQDEVFLLLGL
jgi:hypothetical protein